MTHQSTYFTKAFFLVTCLALGCSSGGTLGCGSGGDATPKVDSDLLGVYRIDSYQGSQDNCDQVSDIAFAPDYMTFYSYVPSGASEQPRLGGTFCNSVEDCRDRAELAAAPALGYTFFEGSDEGGWLGWGITNAGNVNDQCQADVQTHTLTSTTGQAVQIETRTVETVFMPTVDGTEATCRNADALEAAADPDLPCKAILVVEATFETEN